MTVYEETPPNFTERLSMWFNHRMLWLSKHWLAIANTFFFTYVGLPFLAPILMAAGFTRAANTIYQMYNLVCHQLPTRTYFVFGEQVAMCQRCIAIYLTLAIGGIVFNLVRFRALSFKWYILFALPMALDGGSAFVSELAQVIPLWIFWVMWTVIVLITAIVMFKQQILFWQMWVVFAGGFLALAYLQFVGLRISDATFRTVTGAVFGIGTVWYAYPILEEGFKDTVREATYYLYGYRYDEEPPPPTNG
jgi:uncharacterized membrane protein